MTDQPETIEVSTSMYSCGECGFNFLDRIFWEPEDGEPTDFLACRNCGYNNAHYACGIYDEEWFTEIYTEIE